MNITKEEMLSEPMHPEMFKAFEDYFDKAYKQLQPIARTWVGLTEEEVQWLIEALEDTSYCIEPNTNREAAALFLRARLTSQQPRSPSPASADPQDQAFPTVLASFL